jgi:hypothetical protein
MAHRAGIRWDHARWIDERRLLPSASRSSGNGAHARRKPQPGQSMRWPVGSSSCGHDKHDDNPASELFRVNEFCPRSGLNGLREKGQNHGKYCGEMLFAFLPHHAVVAGALAVVAFCISRIWRNPASLNPPIRSRRTPRGQSRQRGSTGGRSVCRGVLAPLCGRRCRQFDRIEPWSETALP